MKTIEQIKLEWQEHNRDNGMSWNEVAKLVNEVYSLSDLMKEQAQERFELACVALRDSRMRFMITEEEEKALRIAAGLTD